jgi:GUN4-like
MAECNWGVGALHSLGLGTQNMSVRVQRGIDYEPLREALKEEDFLKADDIHRKKLIEVAGEAAQERGWVYFSEVCSPLLGHGSTCYSTYW